MSDWMFNGEPFEFEDKSYEGFVYLIRNKETGKVYIGRKYFYQIRKEPGKSRRVRKESNWKSYYSSSEMLKEDVKAHGKEAFERHILSLHKTRGDCNRAEIEALWKADALYREDFYNLAIDKHRVANVMIVESRLTSTNMESLIGRKC